MAEKVLEKGRRSLFLEGRPSFKKKMVRDLLLKECRNKIMSKKKSH